MSSIVAGTVLILAGCLHLITDSDQIETRLVTSVQRLTAHKPVLTGFQEIWFLGRTTFAITALLLMIAADWTAGLFAAAIFLLFVGIETLIKTSVNRARPFQASSAILMRQPREPADTSFPSGDALRAWYLALTIPVFADSGLAFALAAICLAILVTFGRIVMGVHYLTDILAGAGLGLVGAGFTIWLWNLFNLL